MCGFPSGLFRLVGIVCREGDSSIDGVILAIGVSLWIGALEGLLVVWPVVELQPL